MAIIPYLGNIVFQKHVIGTNGDMTYEPSNFKINRRVRKIRVDVSAVAIADAYDPVDFNNASSGHRIVVYPVGANQQPIFVKTFTISYNNLTFDLELDVNEQVGEISFPNIFASNMGWNGDWRLEFSVTCFS